MVFLSACVIIGGLVSEFIRSQFYFQNCNYPILGDLTIEIVNKPRENSETYDKYFCHAF